MQEHKTSDAMPVIREISVKEVFDRVGVWKSYLVSKWKLFFLFICIGLLGGLAYSLLTKPTYTATLNFVLEDNGKSKLGGYSGLAAQFGLSIGGEGGGVFQEGENIIAFIKSRTMIVSTLLTEDEFNGRKQLLADRYLDLNNLRKKWAGKPKLSSLKFHTDPAQHTITEDSVLNFFFEKILRENLSVEKPDKKNDLISITTVSTDQLFSKSFTENLLENVSAFYVEGQTRKSHENVMILRRQADSVHSLLNAALTGVAISADANPNPNPAYQRLKVPSQKRMVDVEMNKAILEELVKNLEISEISLRKETPLVQVIDRPVLPLKEGKVTKLKGMVIGAAIGTIFILIFLSIKFFFRRIMHGTDNVEIAKAVVA